MTDAVSSTPAKAGAAASGVQSTAEIAKLKNVAKQFEAVFLRQMIGSMRSSSLGEGIDESNATQQFRDMSDSKMADSMAGHGVLHIADLLIKQFGAKVTGGAAASSSTAAAAPATATKADGQ